MASITIDERDLISITSAIQRLIERLDTLEKTTKKPNTSNGRIMRFPMLGVPQIAPAIGMRVHAFDGITMQIWEGTEDGWKQIL